MDFVLVADEASGGTTASGKASFPEFPEEKPAKNKLVTWLDTWQEDLTAAGYSTLLRGEEPFELAKLRPRPLLPVPADAAAKIAVDNENARITYQNDTNKIEYDTRLIEMKNRLASKIQRALRPKAPLLLSKLMTAHAAKDGMGAVIANTYDGVAMWTELAALRTSGVREYDQGKYEKVSEKIRDTPLPDNVTPQAFSERINLFQVHVNPYLEVEYTGERLGRFILKQLPASLGSDVRSLKRGLEADGKLDDPTEVIERALKLVEEAHDGTKKPPAVANSLVAFMSFDGNPRNDQPKSGNTSEEASGNGMTKKELKSLIASALKESGGGRNGGGAQRQSGDKKSGKGARDADDKDKLRRGNRLPDGQVCKEGFCCRRPTMPPTS
jgi:hypothetical protein